MTAEAMLLRIWGDLWTYDDVTEVCMPVSTRNELGAYLVSIGAIKPEAFEPLTVEEETQ